MPREVRRLFPLDEVKFNVRVGSDTYTTRIDCYRRLFLGSILFGEFELNNPGLRIIIEFGAQNECVVGKKREQQVLNHKFES